MAQGVCGFAPVTQPGVCVSPELVSTENELRLGNLGFKQLKLDRKEREHEQCLRSGGRGLEGRGLKSIFF